MKKLFLITLTLIGLVSVNTGHAGIFDKAKAAADKLTGKTPLTRYTDTFTKYLADGEGLIPGSNMPRQSNWSIPKKLSQTFNEFLPDTRDVSPASQALDSALTDLRAYIKSGAPIPDKESMANLIRIDREKVTSLKNKLNGALQWQGTGTELYQARKAAYESNLEKLQPYLDIKNITIETVYPSMGFTNEEGKKANFETIQKAILNKAQALSGEAGKWYKRQMTYLFDTDIQKKEFDAFLGGPKALQSLIDMSKSKIKDIDQRLIELPIILYIMEELSKSLQT